MKLSREIRFMAKGRKSAGTWLKPKSDIYIEKSKAGRTNIIKESTSLVLIFQGDWFWYEDTSTFSHSSWYEAYKFCRMQERGRRKSWRNSLLKLFSIHLLVQKETSFIPFVNKKKTSQLAANIYFYQCKYPSLESLKQLTTSEILEAFFLSPIYVSRTLLWCSVTHFYSVRQA